MTREQLMKVNKVLGKIGLENIQNIILVKNGDTNSDVIKSLFNITEEHFYDEDRMVDVYGLDRLDDPSTFYADWWNALYN